MGSTEEEIARLLHQGLSPIDVIRQGYKKSTVYKVYSKRSRDPSSTHKGNWFFENVRSSKERYLPGDVITVWGSLKNNTPYDFYVAKVGIQPEWMKDQWYSQDVRDLLKPNSSKQISFTLPIPSDLPLGEYTYTFGIEGPFLGATAISNISPYPIEWSEPNFFEIKYQKRGVKIFISYSTMNKSLIYQIESFLDNYGYDVIIAEDRKEPGVLLLEKFQRLIRESHLVLALWTDEGARSKWVIEETNYAYGIGKPLLLLKEENTKLQSELEWIEFSRNDPPNEICRKVTDAVQNIQHRTGGISPLIGLGLLGLFLLILGSSSDK